MAKHHFHYQTPLSASVETVFAWHEAPGAFEKLTPPWAPVYLQSHVGGIQDGAIVTLSLGLPKIGLLWVLRHQNYIQNQQFEDYQVQGPFADWHHRHQFIPTPSGCLLEDSITYELPFSTLSQPLVSGLIDTQLKRLFAYRETVLKAELCKPSIAL